MSEEDDDQKKSLLKSQEDYFLGGQTIAESNHRQLQVLPDADENVYDPGVGWHEISPKEKNYWQNLNLLIPRFSPRNRLNNPQFGSQGNSMADDTTIDRNNPYDVGAAQAPAQAQTIPPANTQTVPNQTIVAPNLSPQMRQQIEEQEPTSNAPLSTQGFAKKQIESAENCKYLTGEGAEIAGQGLEKESVISGDAAKENLQNQQESQAALKKAMADADIRDQLLRTQIQQAAAAQPDPDRWWHTRSTAGKVAAGIGLMLGAVGQGMSRHGEGQNTALQLIHGAIDQDIQSQKDSIANNWKGIAATHELDDNAFNRELHNQSWQNNYRIGGLERVKLELQSAASKTQSDIVRQNAKVGIQDLSDLQDKIRNHLYILGQQSALDNLARMRKLQEQAGKDVQDRVQQGATLEAAEQSVYSQANNRELIHAGMAPDSVLQAEYLKNQFQGDISKARSLAESTKLVPGSPGYDALIAQVTNNPKYAPLLQSINQGRIVPNNKVAAPGSQLAAEKDLRDRTVTIDGKQYVANSEKEAEQGAVAVNAAKEVKRINARIMQLTNQSGPLGPGERAELDSLLDQGALHFPRMQTGSARVNDTEITMGKDTYQGKGDWYRGDLLGRKKGHLASINAQADDRIADVMNGLKPLNIPGPGVVAPQPNQGRPTVEQMNQKSRCHSN